MQTNGDKFLVILPATLPGALEELSKNYKSLLQSYDHRLCNRLDKTARA
jgi:hypothetical protein